jgi:hypothetical protein
MLKRTSTYSVLVLFAFNHFIIISEITNAVGFKIIYLDFQLVIYHNPLHIFTLIHIEFLMMSLSN